MSVEYMHVIDTDNYGARGITTLVFSGGEPHVTVPKFDGPVVIHAKPRTWLDFGLLLLVIDAPNTQRKKCHVFMPYLPGARQDRNAELLPYYLRTLDG